jgi:phage-related protein
MLSTLWDEHLKALVEEVLNFVGKLTQAALDILNEFVLPVIYDVVEVLAPALKEAFDFIIDVVGSALGGIVDAATGIIKALGGIIDFIAGVFTDDWERAWEGVKTIFEGIFDAVIGIFKGAINILIDSMNFLIRSMNKISFDVPDWVPGIGGNNFGISIAEIPKLAKGGLAFGPTLAMVGDNINASIDPEVIMPISKLENMLESILTKTTGATGTHTEKRIYKIGESELAEIIIEAINSHQRQIGNTVLEV